MKKYECKGKCFLECGCKTEVSDSSDPASCILGFNSEFADWRKVAEEKPPKLVPSEARLCRWTDDEMKQRVGKAFEDINGEIHLCLGFKIYKEICGENKQYGVLYMAGCGPVTHSAECLLEDGWKIDGSPCGTLEHFDENRKEWVK